jgi:hypothetical protein
MNRVKDVKSGILAAYTSVMRRLGMTPMRRLLEELKRRQVDVGTLRALDLFASDGDLQTMDFASEVSSLEVWEINATCEGALKRNLPHARIRIVDAFEEVKRTDEKFDLVVVDAPTQVYGGNGAHCEHFDLFPDVLRVLKPAAIIVLNVVPRISKQRLRRAARNGWRTFGQAHLAERGRFYRTSTPENTPFDQMILVYERLIRDHGFEIDWHFFKKKQGCYYYLVLRVRGSFTTQAGPAGETAVDARPLVGSDL